MKTFLKTLSLSCITIGMIGCVNGVPITDHPPRWGYDHNAQTSAPKTVELSTPLVHYLDNTMTVSGTARKIGGGDEKISGSIDVQFLDPNGNVVDETLAKLSPSTLTSSPSTYKISVWNANPRKAQVRVVFIDQRDVAAFYGDVTNVNGGSGMPTTSGNFSRGGGGGYGGGGSGWGYSGGISGPSLTGVSGPSGVP